jgi:hypothetical protein
MIFEAIVLLVVGGLALLGLATILFQAAVEAVRPPPGTWRVGPFAVHVPGDDEDEGGDYEETCA